MPGSSPGSGLPPRPAAPERPDAGRGSGLPWIRRFVAEPSRAREAADLYRSLGHEVRLEPAAEEDLPTGCGDCALARGLYRTLYTRRRA